MSPKGISTTMAKTYFDGTMAITRQSVVQPWHIHCKGPDPKSPSPTNVEDPLLDQAVFGCILSKTRRTCAGASA